MALFEPSPIGNTDGHAHIVEMRAGKMYRQGTWVYPDKRKGSLYIYRNSDDLMHFCWRDRTTFAVEDDFIIFPGDCTYTKVKQCTTGRVYVLRFESSTVRMFYWLQEPKTDKDDEHCRRINYLLNHPPHHQNTLSSAFNITEAQLSRIFGPDVAAQLSALVMNEEHSRFAGRSGSVDRNNSGTHTKHDTTPLSESGTSAEDQNTANKRKSNLKTDVNESFKTNGKKQTKSVTILDAVDSGKTKSKDQIDKKNEKKTAKTATTGGDLKDGSDEDDDQDTIDGSHTDDDDDKSK
ncbi:proteasomal ubiquitin receptor ADRM1 homolog [Coccinella septempunctata]|uniref:proteasomal ubiquitin receptor ADRM1 homolog n=1 Tax=Coccinella septempunctata TaxID=41139 RepID=UPI001D05DE5F|nr:proteasomal ubiquitin receptor ADRM1 homolog [Coccinella septempunctata]